MAIRHPNPPRPTSNGPIPPIPNARARSVPVRDSVAAERIDSDSPSDRLSALLDQYSHESAGLRLYAERISVDGVPVYLGAVPFNEDLYDAVRDRWGGGRYGGRIIGQGNKYKGRIPTFEIAGRPRDDDDDEPRPRRTSDVPPQSPVRIDAVLGEALATMARGIDQTQLLIRELLQRSNPASTDPTEQFVKLAKIVRDLAPPPAASAAPVPTESVVGMMRDLMQLQRELSDAPSQAPSGTLGTIIREGVAPLVGVLNRKMDLDQRKAGAEGVRRLNPQASVQPVAAASASIDPASLPADELEALLTLIPMHARSFLLSCAQRETPPENYAGMVLDNLSDEAYDAMPRLLARSDFVDVLVRVVPAYGAYRAWFTGLVDAMRASVADVEDTAGETVGTSGEAAAARRVDSAEAVA